MYKTTKTASFYKDAVFYVMEEIMEESRIAIIGIIIDDMNITSDVNELLHDYGIYILGRMGVPYRQKSLNIISIVIDAPADVINQLAGKLGRLSGVSVKTMYSKMP
jgi:putative iron-only hydrogenase system regulator